jgi:hypothetical protein
MRNAEKILTFYKGIDQGNYGPDARCKPFWHRENFNHFLRGEDFLVKPVTVEYWPSLLCNSRCHLCPYRRNGARAEADLAVNGIIESKRFFAGVTKTRQIASECKKMGVLSVLLTGGGEPFFNPAVDQIARAFAENGISLGIYSNGTVAAREQSIRAVSDLNPRFVRLSVNAGSSIEHRREYKIPSGWDLLCKNSRLWARALAKDIPLSFSWVLTGNEPPDTYKGAGKFLLDLHHDTNRNISGHFRPKYTYYNKDGSVHCPGSVNFYPIIDSVNAFVRPVVQNEPGIDIQINTYAIDISKTESGPQASFATGWATSLTHRGDGYITSELNGSAWPNTCWGRIGRDEGGDTVSFEELWFGKERYRLWRLYSQEARLPIYHKLTGLSNVLKALRELCPEPFTVEETDDFWNKFNREGFKRPSNWDFI